jgi:hypothetical protein
MSERIQDGKGRGFEAEVDDKHQLHVFSVSEAEVTNVSVKDGESYLFSADYADIITTGTETGIMYIQNTNTEKDLFIQNVRTCGTVVQLWRLHDATAASGTLVSDATVAASNNMNFTSANTATTNVYQGTEGSTLLNGTRIENWINNAGHSVEEYEGSVILGTNDAIALTCEVLASGTVCARVIGFYK